jgi:hypothetical protein
MRHLAKTAIGALMFAGATFAMSSPASAYVGVEFGFGGPDFVFGDPCDYYDYYDAAPPWGLPPDYCEYPVYFEPVYFDGSWYRGPIYYRWTHGRRLFWLHGGWHEDAWRGPRPARIDWQARGGANHGFRPGVHIGGSFHTPMGSHLWSGGNRGNGGGRPWIGSGNHGDGGNHFGGGDRGDGGSHFGGGGHGNFGSHGPH